MLTLFIIAVILLFVAPRLAVFLILAGLVVLGIIVVLGGGAIVLGVLGLGVAIAVNS